MKTGQELELQSVDIGSSLFGLKLERPSPNKSKLSLRSHQLVTCFVLPGTR